MCAIHAHKAARMTVELPPPPSQPTPPTFWPGHIITQFLREAFSDRSARQ